MKKLFILFALFASLGAAAQSSQGTSEVFVFQPVSSQRVRSTDSVQVFATLVTNHLVQGIAWSQVSGPAMVKFSAVTSYYGASVATSAFWLDSLVAGTYVFKATGQSSSGTSGSVTDTLTVIPAIVCPICPAPRTMTSITLPFLGQNITIPASAIPPGSIKYNDGTNQ